MCTETLPIVLSVAILVGCTDRQKEPIGSSSAASTATAAKTAAAQPEPSMKPPDVPPLEQGETPPTRGPNYFEPHEMASTGMATAFDSCMSSIEQSGANLQTWQRVPYCACIVDAWRASIHATGDADKAPMPGRDELKKCDNLDGGVGPYGVPFPKDTPSLYNSWKTCVDAFPEQDHGVYCGCYTDGVFKNPGFLTITPEDDKRCTIADQYYQATKKHLTVRQFQGLVGLMLGDVPKKARSLMPKKY